MVNCVVREQSKIVIEAIKKIIKDEAITLIDIADLDENTIAEMRNGIRKDLRDFTHILTESEILYNSVDEDSKNPLQMVMEKSVCIRHKERSMQGQILKDVLAKTQCRGRKL